MVATSGFHAKFYGCDILDQLHNTFMKYFFSVSYVFRCVDKNIIPKKKFSSTLLFGRFQ